MSLMKYVKIIPEIWIQCCILLQQLQMMKYIITKKLLMQ